MKKKKIQPDRVKEKSATYGSYVGGPFAVIIEQDENGFFVGSVPALPGCHTQGKTLIELRSNIRDAIRLCLDVASADLNYRNKIKQVAYRPSFIGMEMVSI